MGFECLVYSRIWLYHHFTPHALAVAVYTFAIEDIHGVRAEKQGDEIHIVFDGSKRTMDESIFKMLSAWADQAEKLKNGEISKDQYDRWRYTFPAEDTTQVWAKVPSQQLSDAMVEAFKGRLKAD